MRGTTILLVVAMFATSITAFCEVPPLLNYQGLLRDSEGELLPDGNYSVTFRIWNSETDGDTLWAEGRLVEARDGLFHVLLGSVVSITDSVFNSPDCWLGVQIGLDPEMTPRSRLVTVPFAWHSSLADSAIHSRDKTIDAGELITGNLDPNRFSAYDDLAGEGKIGDQMGQIAAGEHSHNIMGLGRVEDTTSIEMIVAPIDGEVIVKSFDIPGYIFDGHFLRIVNWVEIIKNDPISGRCQIKVYVNGTLIHDWDRDENWSIIQTEWLVRKPSSNTWAARIDLNGTGSGAHAVDFTIDSSLPVNISLTAQIIGGESSFAVTIQNSYVVFGGH